MNTIVYLDQNIISDLRDRKLFETKNKQLMMLKSILMRHDVDVVYSHVTLDEIRQICVDDYFVEHFYVLEQLEAKYIEPLSKNIVNEKPHKVCLNYLKNLKVSYNTPYPYFAKIIEELSRKLSGLPIDKSLEDIGNNMINGVNNITNNAIEQINSLNENDYEEPTKSLVVIMKKIIPQLLKKSLSASNPFTNTANIPLGTKPFREQEPIKKFMDSNPSGSNLVAEMTKVLNDENSIFNIKASLDDSIENKIIYTYILMNWLGYYADDFDKIKRQGKDRFNASQNDMRHASYAHIASYLISNDKPFREKAVVSYEFANIKTVVCTPDRFLEEYSFSKKIKIT